MNINWDDLLNALALVLIIEGILPFASPATLKQTWSRIAEMPEPVLRKMGLGSILIGLLVLFFH